MMCAWVCLCVACIVLFWHCDLILSLWSRKKPFVFLVRFFLVGFVSVLMYIFLSSSGAITTPAMSDLGMLRDTLSLPSAVLALVLQPHQQP